MESYSGATYNNGRNKEGDKMNDEVINSLAMRIAQLEVDKAVYKSELITVKKELHELKEAINNKEDVEEE